MIKEACVDSLEQALMAQHAGADQIELCARLDLDGLTPEPELVKEVVRHLSIPVKVMIRPRAGNFIYNQEEIEIMKSQVLQMKELGITQMVTGMLTENNTIDVEALNQIVKFTDPISVTFHKAIDLVDDRKQAVQQLINIKNVKYILSSGGAKTAWQGRDELIRMKEWADKKIHIIAAGKVTWENLDQLHQILGMKYYHGKKIVNT